MQPHPQSTWARLKSYFEGVRWAGRGETYEVLIGKSTTWTCIRRDKQGTKKFTLSYDPEYSVVYWGTDRAYYFDAAELHDGSDEISWYSFADWHKKRARFSWKRTTAESDVAASPQDPLAASAIREIEAQLADPRYDGRIRLPYWSSYYGRLGSLRGFTESWPSHFVVVPGRAHRFTVAAAGAGEANATKTLAETAVSAKAHVPPGTWSDASGNQKWSGADARYHRRSGW